MNNAYQSQYERVTKCLEIIRSKTDFVPKVAVVLGSGLGDFAEEIDIKATVNYSEIEGFPQSTVPGHKGRFVFGYINDVPVVAMQGRVHFYEGYPISDVVLPVRLMHAMGAEYLFLSNAAGGIGDGFKAGNLMMITDHISTFVPNPLIGPNEEKFGTRFPDMSNVYRKDLQNIIRECAADLKIPLKEGIYIQLSGPSYESPAEIRMCKMLGASAVGMSTVVEAIAANHMGMKVLGVSLITNLAAGISEVPLSHEEVQQAADEAGPKFKALVKAVITKINE